METKAIKPKGVVANWQTRREWLEDGKSCIGSSDMQAILGLSSWSSPYAVWVHKTEPLNERDLEPPDEISEWGLRLEDAIAVKFREVTGKAVVDPGPWFRVRNPGWNIAACSPDVLVEPMTWVDDVLTCGDPLDCKTAHFGAGKEWLERVPLAYVAQLQWQMYVLQRDTAYSAVLVDGYRFQWHTVPRNERFIGEMVLRARAFWDDYVLAGEPPPTDFSEATRQALTRLYPTSVEQSILLDDSFEGAGAEWDRLADVIRKAEQEQQAIANRVKDAAGANERIRLPGEPGGWTWKTGKRSRTFRRAAKVQLDLGEGGE